MSQVIEFVPQEKVHYIQKRGGREYPKEAVVLKINKKLVRIKCKMDGRAWQFFSVRPEELKKLEVANEQLP